MAFNFFYLYLIPYAVILTLVGTTLFYWSNKHILLRTSRKPEKIGGELAKKVMDVYQDLIIVCATFGAIVF